MNFDVNFNSNSSTCTHVCSQLCCIVMWVLNACVSLDVHITSQASSLGWDLRAQTKEEIIEMTIPYHGLEDVIESMAT